MNRMLHLVIEKAWGESHKDYAHNFFPCDQIESLPDVPSEFMCTMNLFANQKRAVAALEKYDELRALHPLRQILDPIVHRIIAHLRRSCCALAQYDSKAFYAQAMHLRRIWLTMPCLPTDSGDDDSCVPQFTHQLYKQIGQSVLDCAPAQYAHNNFEGLSTSTWLSLGQVLNVLLICSVRMVVFERHVTECPLPFVQPKHNPTWRRHWKSIQCAAHDTRSLHVQHCPLHEAMVHSDTLNRDHARLESFMYGLINCASNDYRTCSLRLLCLSWTLWGWDPANQTLPDRPIHDKTFLDIDPNGIRGHLRSSSYAIERHRRIRGVAQGRRSRKISMPSSDVFFDDLTVVLFAIV